MPTRVVPDWLVRVIALFDPTVRMVTDQLESECHPSSAKARRLLGWQTRSMRETMLDTARDLQTRAPTGRPWPAAR